MQMNGAPIVVGIDGSDSSKAALEWAADFARMTGSPLELVWAWEIPTSYGWPVLLPDDCDFEADARKALSETAAQVLGADPKVDYTEQLVEGHPAVVLTKRSESAGLLVVGSRGLGVLRGALLGSVSAHLATHAHCPLVIFRDHHRATTQQSPAARL